MEKNKKFCNNLNNKLSVYRKSNKCPNNNFDINNLFSNKFIKRKEKIHFEIYNLINENMQNIENKLDNISSDENLVFNISKTFDEDNFKNYSGEKLSIISFSNSTMKNNSLEKDIKTNNNSFQNYDILNNKNNDKLKNEYINESISNYIYINSKKKKKIIKNKTKLKKTVIPNIKKTYNINYAFDTLSDKETILNNSNYLNLNISSSDIFDNDNTIEDKEINIQNIFSCKKDLNKININSNTTQKTPKKNSTIQIDNFNKIKTSNKEGKLNYISYNFSLYDSTSTSNTYDKKKNKFKFHQSTDENYNNENYSKRNEIELINFFNEINLPSIYTNKFIVNGFDDLNVLLILTQSGIAITNQNLKDIGIMNAGDRAKILIHLEEKAEIIPYYLETDIIYSNSVNNSISEYNDRNMKDRLFNFLKEIGCDRYINNFKLNGYFNIELLLSQMLTRQPIDKNMLKDDFYIDNENNRNKILKKLEIETKNYVKKLKGRSVCSINNTIVYDDKIYRNSCEPCIVF